MEKKPLQVHLSQMGELISREIEDGEVHLSPLRIFLNFTRPEGFFQGCLSVASQSSWQDDIQNPLFAKTLLNEIEQFQFKQYQFAKRQNEFLLGRLVSKVAISEVINNSKDAREAARRDPWTQLRSIEIGNDIFNRPFAATNSQWDISLSHSHGSAVALAFPHTHPMGIDIEKIDSKHSEVVSHEMTDNEKEVFSRLNLPGVGGYTLNWTIKEAYSKAIGVGLTTPFKVMEVKEIQMLKVDSPANQKLYYFESWLKNFHQFRVHSWLTGGHAISIAIPYKTVVEWTQIESTPLKFFTASSAAA